jgi:hypothetical protein
MALHLQPQGLGIIKAQFVALWVAICILFFMFAGSIFYMSYAKVKLDECSQAAEAKNQEITFVIRELKTCEKDADFARQAYEDLQRQANAAGLKFKPLLNE